MHSYASLDRFKESTATLLRCRNKKSCSEPRASPMDFGMGNPSMESAAVKFFVRLQKCGCSRHCRTPKIKVARGVENVESTLIPRQNSSDRMQFDT